jgi:hypothetical protein
MTNEEEREFDEIARKEVQARIDSYKANIRMAKAELARIELRLGMIPLPAPKPRGSHKCKEVAQYPKKVSNPDRPIRTYESAAAAARVHSPSRNSQSILLCCNGKVKTAHHYRWKFVDQPDQG